MGRKILKYTEEQIRRWHLVYSNPNLTVTQAAAELGVNEDTFPYWFRRYGLPVRKQGFQKSNFKGRYNVELSVQLSKLYEWFYTNAYKRRARRKKLEFSITLEQFIKLVTSECHYCGKPYSKEKRKVNKHLVSMLTVDRADASKGYVIENCLPSCKRCNTIKMDATAEEFLNHISSILEHMKRNGRWTGRL